MSQTGHQMEVSQPWSLVLSSQQVPSRSKSLLTLWSLLRFITLCQSTNRPDCELA